MKIKRSSPDIMAARKKADSKNPTRSAGIDAANSARNLPDRFLLWLLNEYIGYVLLLCFLVSLDMTLRVFGRPRPHPLWRKTMSHKYGLAYLLVYVSFSNVLSIVIYYYFYFHNPILLPYFLLSPSLPSNLGNRRVSRLLHHPAVPCTIP